MSEEIFANHQELEKPFEKEKVACVPIEKQLFVKFLIIFSYKGQAII